MASSGYREGPVDALRRLKADLDKGDIKPLYLLMGAETFLVNEAFEAIRAAATREGPASFNAQHFEGKGADLRAVIDGAMMLPMMAPRRLVTLKDVDQAPAAGRKQLAAYCAAPSETTTLLMSAGDGRKVRDISAAVKKKGEAFSFRALYEREVPVFIRGEAEAMGKQIDARGARYLQEMVGANLGEVRSQLKKASLFAGEGSRITVQDMEAVVSDISLETIFSFLDACGRGDGGQALLILNRMLESSEKPIRVLGMMHRHFRELFLTWQGVKVEGQSMEDVMVSLGISGGRQYIWKKNAIPQLRGWTGEGLRDALGQIHDTHMKLRSSLPPQLVLESLVLNITALRGRGGARPQGR